jgi:hypothetical protein
MPFSVKKIKGIDTSDLEKLGASVVDLAKYTEDEFSQVASALQGTDPNPIWNVPLPRPRRGTVVYADGTHWNPGQGEGPYWFDGTLYHPMGQNAAPGTIVKTVKVQTFTSSGTYTPSPGMIYCLVECVGGGGGGGGSTSVTPGYSGGSGGGGGAYSRALLSAATVGVSQTVTIGVGGAAGAAAAGNGGNGGTSSFGTLVTAPGGSGGAGNAGIALPGAGGAGGVAGTGNLSVPGQPGGQPVRINAGGGGGNSNFGGASGLGFGYGGTTLSPGGGAAPNPGVAGALYGGGGSGSLFQNIASSNAAGGAGAPGVTIVTEYCSQ